MVAKRIRIISYLILALALMLVAKLYSVQIIHYSDFADRADRQYQRPSGTVFNRGTIYFQSKAGQLISAGTLKSGFSVAINPKIIQANISASSTVNGIYEKLSAVIKLDSDDFTKRANKKNDSYEEIAKRVDEETGKKIDALKIPGVSIYKEKWRYYPGGDLAANVLGFMGFKGDEYAGRYGLEKYYEDVLKRDSDNVYVNFFAEIFSNVKSTVVDGEKMEGDLVTTIEPDTQKYLEDTLKHIQEAYSSQITGGIIMDPMNGQIVAMAKNPSFNPNDLSQVKDISVFSNDLVENVYEMGSIIKPLTMAIGIDVGKVTATTTYNDKGFIKVDDRTINNFDKKGRGVIPLMTAMAKSLNTGFVFIEQLVGKEIFKKYVEAFGLGQRTGIDLPDEAKGLIDSLNFNRDVDYAAASFGQGIAMSPIETIRAEATIANGGYLVTPHVVQSINYRIGISKNVEPENGARVLKEDTALAVTRMLVNNVDTSLLNGKSSNPRYSVAAKTGTAQIQNKSGGGYYADKNLHSFIGFLPAYKPRFIVFLYTVNPRGVDFASDTLAKPFIDLTKYLINYYQLPPDRGSDDIVINKKVASSTSSTASTASSTPAR
jgi:cell division protein FtsI (penicillin-binding protein 3)/stage V sporulation protein D (sporulation-specific penicillin-binding protein)